MTQIWHGSANALSVVLTEPADYVFSHLKMEFAEWVVSIRQPFNVVESPNFRATLTPINAKVRIPSRLIVRRSLVVLMGLMEASAQ